MLNKLKTNVITTNVDFAGLRNFILFVNITPRLACCTVSISTVVIAETAVLKKFKIECY